MALGHCFLFCMQDGPDGWKSGEELYGVQFIGLAGWKSGEEVHQVHYKLKETGVF
ncbi:hypothetical protein JOC55_005552 [Paenibacillus sacheonensis]|nr:hypothetical protein [Paenibacillus sacheonensis]